MKKILILANNDIGLYSFRRELIEALLAKNYQVLLALPGGERVIDLIKMGCMYYQVEIDRRGTNPLKDFSLFMKYMELLKRDRPDMILTYTVKPNIYGGLAARFQKKAYIANITGLGTAIENGGWKRCFLFFLYRHSLKRAKCVFFQNRENQHLFVTKHIVWGKERLIPGSGVNTEYHKFEEYPQETEPMTFLFVGRIMRNKGVDELLAAIERIREKHPFIRFQVAGFCEERYEEKLRHFQEKQLIEYLGYQKDIRPYIKKCWALIQPSYNEGLSNVLLEASAAGRPVLASRIPGCREAFDEGISGIGFEARSAESLIQAVLSFIELPYAEKKRMGQAARKKIEREFDRRIVTEAYMEEIQNTVG